MQGLESRSSNLPGSSLARLCGTQAAGQAAPVWLAINTLVDLNKLAGESPSFTKSCQSSLLINGWLSLLTGRTVRLHKQVHRLGSA